MANIQTIGEVMLDGFFLLILIRWHPRPTNINEKTKTPLHNLSKICFYLNTSTVLMPDLMPGRPCEDFVIGYISILCPTFWRRQQVIFGQSSNDYYNQCYIAREGRKTNDTSE